MGYHPIVSRIILLLQQHNFWFERFEHEPVRTSEQAAKVRPDYSLAQGAKALIVRFSAPGGKFNFAMLVIPGDKRLDNKKVKQALGVKQFSFASEQEVSEITGGVVVGGVPPFGNLFNLEVITDPTIFQHEKIIFNAGDRRVSIGMYSRDYKTVVNPRVETIT